MLIELKVLIISKKVREPLSEKQKELWVTPEALAAHVARQCLTDTLEPADIVPTVLFLASSASKMVTSQLWAVDGGVVVSG